MINSRDNKQIKWLFKLQKKKYRDASNTFLIYGDQVINEAKIAGCELELYTSNPNKEGTLISDALMKELSLTQTPFDTLAITKKVENKPFSKRILMLDEIQDPGNLGTLIRTAAGFGFKTVISSKDTVDYYNDKTIRATQGTLFNMNLVNMDLTDILVKLKEDGYQILMSVVNGAENIEDIKIKDKVVLVLGNEGSGISKDIQHYADKHVTIETKGIESLNVSVAGGILMYEVSKHD
ncbi:MAG: RNA methyltransferase [Acholeplasmataceae bacterium]|nr:RNA methyltransferase [Acholeplasmataceae bacterium]